MARRYDVIVVGGGPGGLSCAALLSKWGLRTLLLEKNEVTGGKAVTASRDGFQYELGPMLQMPRTGQGFETLFRELGIGSALRPIRVEAGSQSYRGRSGSYATLLSFQGKSGEKSQYDLWGLDAGERERVERITARMIALSSSELDELDDVTMQEYLDFYGVPQAFYDCMATQANALLCEPVDLVAASEQIKILQHVAAGGGSGYYRGGFGRVLDDVADSFLSHGGTIQTGAKVEAINVAEGRVRGVSTEKADFEAPIVVSNAGIQPTVLKLVGEKHFEDHYVRYVTDLVPSWGWASVRYFLGAPVMTSPVYAVYAEDSWLDLELAERVHEGFVPEEVIMLITVPSNLDPAMAPPGKQCLISGTICPADPASRVPQMLYEKLDAMLEKLFPEAWAAVESRECEGPAEVSARTRDQVFSGQGGERIGIGQIVGQCGRFKPSAESPLAGLYFTGCDAGGGAMGTHQASTSGIRVARIVREAFRRARF